MSELEQWCEIEGHDYLTVYQTVGVGLERITTTCKKCLACQISFLACLGSYAGLQKVNFYE